MAVRVSKSGIRLLVKSGITDFVVRVGREVQRRAQALSPVDSGRLRRSIETGRPRSTSTSASVKVSTNTGYGLYPESGTGIFGPTGRVIRPKKAPFLVFQPRGLGHVIKVRSVRGQPGQHYMRTALLATIRRL